jgi:hypothetical protein
MGKGITFGHSFSAENPVSHGELVSLERTLARLVAEAFAADHSEIFAARRRAMPIMGSRAKSGPDLKGQAEQGIAAGESNAHIG